MESVIYLLAFVVSIIVLFKSGLKEIAWALILMPIMVIFLIIVVIWQIKSMVDNSQKTYSDILREKANDAKKELIQSDADAKISELEKKIVLGEDLDEIKTQSEKTTDSGTADVSISTTSNNSGCFMAGQNKNAPGDHIGNKSCRENKLFMNDKCKSKCGVKTDVGMNICCNETCCHNKNVIAKQDTKKQYFEKNADLEDVYDQIRDDSDEKSQVQTEKYFNYDPSEPKELSYKNFV
tara:strand:- start:6622 stop:7332 length:711 start_codon:yes stop_codon:yes gene_type:complete